MADPQAQKATDTPTASTPAAKAAKKEVQYEAVTLTDGRIADFAGKTRLQKMSQEKDGKLSVRLDFRNGETRTFELPKALLVQFALHGAEQKLGDEIAGVTDIDDAVTAIDELILRLNAGDWSIRREPGSSLAGASVLQRALIEQSGKSADVVKAFLATKSHAEKMALRSMPAIKVIIDRLEADKTKKATKDVDTTALLAGLEAA